MVRPWPVYLLPKLSTPKVLLNNEPGGTSSCRLEVPILAPGCSTALAGAPALLLQQDQAALERLLLDRLTGNDALCCKGHFHLCAAEACRTAGLDAIKATFEHRDADTAAVDQLRRHIGARQEVAVFAIQRRHARRRQAQIVKRCFLADQSCESRLDLGRRQQGDAFNFETVDPDPDIGSGRSGHGIRWPGQRRCWEHRPVSRWCIKIEDGARVRSEHPRRP